jgi:hypothetical protein
MTKVTNQLHVAKKRKTMQPFQISNVFSNQCPYHKSNRVTSFLKGYNVVYCRSISTFFIYIKSMVEVVGST